MPPASVIQGREETVISTETIPDDPLYINEVAALIDRRPVTIRMWIRNGLLPVLLLPTRGSRRRYCWSAEQVDGIKTWMVEAERYPGRGLPHMRNRTEAEIARHIQALRKNTED